MIVLSNTVAQTLAPGEAATFNDVILHSGCGECHRTGTSSVKMRANGVYAVSFSGNIGATAPGLAEITIQLSGSNMPETNIKSVTATAGDLNNVSTTTKVKNCCGDFDRLTVVNTGTTEITLDSNPSFIVKREG